MRVAGEDAPAWGLPATPLMNTRMAAGRWYSASEAVAGADVAVLGKTIAKTLGAGVGDTIRVGTSGGAKTLRVIGVSANQANNGGVIFLPTATLQTALGTPGLINNYWIATTLGQPRRDRPDHHRARGPARRPRLSASARSSTTTPGSSRSRPTG